MLGTKNVVGDGSASDLRSSPSRHEKLHQSGGWISVGWLPAFRARFVDTGQKALGVYEFTFVLRLFTCCFSVVFPVLRASLKNHHQ